MHGGRSFSRFLPAADPAGGFWKLGQQDEEPSVVSSQSSAGRRGEGGADPKLETGENTLGPKETKPLYSR